MIKQNKETTFTEFVNNLRCLDLYDNVTVIASTSDKAKKLISQTIKFIFIDGNHSQFGSDFNNFKH